MAALPIFLSDATLISTEHGVCAVGSSATSAAKMTRPIIGLNYAAGLILDDEKKLYVATWSSFNHSISDNYMSPDIPASSTLTEFQVELFEHACPVSLVAASSGMVICDWAPVAINGAVYVIGDHAKAPHTLALLRVSYIDKQQTHAITYPKGQLILLSRPIKYAQDLLEKKQMLHLAAYDSSMVHILNAQDLHSQFGRKEVWAEYLRVPISNRRPTMEVMSKR